MMILAAIVLIALLAVMACAYLIQRALHNAGWIDVFWTLGTGAAAVWLSLAPIDGEPSDRQGLVATLAAIWSLRLGLFVAFRVAGSPEEDARYKDLREEWGSSFQKRMLPFILIQAPIAFLLAAIIALAARAPWGGLNAFDGLGALILIVAVGGETLADEQMRRFKASHPPKGAINDQGLWGWSRHPNYFFEWFGWLAYPVILMAHASVYFIGWVAWGAPVLMYLVLNHGTGVPPLEARMSKSRGEAFAQYKSRTSRFFLWPPRKPTA